MSNQQDFAQRPSPAGWPRISSTLFYDDAPAAIDWLCRVFGFRVRLKVQGDDGSIIHSELDFGTDGLIMVGSAGPDRHGTKPYAVSPQRVQSRNTQCLCVVVDDADRHCAAAEGAGAKILVRPATHDYGDDYWADRTYLAEDLEGHRWWFMQRVRDPR